MHGIVSSADKPRSLLTVGVPAAGLSLVSVCAVILGVMLTKDLFLGSLAVAILAMPVVIFVRPTAATLICVFLIYINAPAVAVNLHGVPPVLASAVIGLLLAPVFYFVVWKREPLCIDTALPWLLLFCVIQLISALGARDKALAMEAVCVFLAEALILYVLVINSVRNFNVTWVLIAAGVFMGSLGIVQKATGTYWRDYKGFALVSEPELNAYGEIVGGRWPAGPIGDKNYYAQFMLMLVPFAIYRFAHERSWTLRLAGLGGALIILAGIALTGSRGAAVGFAAMMLVMIALRHVKLRDGVILVALAGLLMLAMPEYRTRVASMASVFHVLRGEDIRQTDAAMQGRLSEMAAALLVFLEHPLRGVGPGNFPSHFVEKADLLGFTMHHGERRAHCLYLEVAAETGILGVGCFLVVLGLTVKNLLDAHAAADSKELQGMAAAAIAAMVAMMATGVFLSFAYMHYYWLMIGLCSAIARIVLQSTHRCVAHVGSSVIEGTPP